MFGACGVDNGVGCGWDLLFWYRERAHGFMLGVNGGQSGSGREILPERMFRCEDDDEIDGLV